MVLIMVLLLAKQIITLYHTVQKTLMKDQHALAYQFNAIATYRQITAKASIVISSSLFTRMLL
ncbi:hypothetical protein F0244_01490 [Vibrio mediterranei]|nr:hypothetical protein [Vibrio mediterranei]